ncbi:PAS domain S-box protein [Sulfurivermis fontis]|uniref:PAS domain S-box protein n=1 Tax=Sulfurivermis fontis TaxID=1972068 RepID=UPI000FDB5FCC|nr:PAS domain S-box protein [Sulfurivermis fontis]
MTSALRLLLPLLLCLGAPLHAEPAALQPVSLQLKWYHQFQFAGYYAALEQGYYHEAGLDVTIREGHPERDPVADVAAGKADFGIGASELLLARAQGAPVVAVAVIFQHSPLILLAKRGPDVDSVHDLIGKPLQIVPHEHELFAFIQALGLSPEDFVLEPRRDNLDDLLAGRVAAVAAYSTDEPWELRRRKIDYLEITPRSAGIDFYGDSLFTSERLARLSPETVRAFRDASLRGWAYALSHPEETAALIQRRYNRGKDIEHLLYEAHAMQRLILPELVELGYMNPLRWKHIADSYAGLGMLPADYDYSGFLFEPTQQADLRLFYWSIGLGALVTLFGGAVIFYIMGLNHRLRASEQRYRVVYQNAPMAIIVSDAQQRVTAWNRQAEQIFGWRADEVMGRRFLDFMVPAEEQEQVLGAVQRAVRALPDSRSLNWNLTKSGARILCEWMNAALHDAHGQLSGVVALAVDVTERNRLQEQLRSSEENYRTLTETAPFPVVVTSLIDDSVLYLNERAEQHFHLNKAEAIGRHAPDYWADPARRTVMVEQLRRDGHVADFEAQLRTDRGQTFWVYLSAALTTYDGKPAAFVSFNDISERKRIEQALRDSERHYRLLAENAFDVIWTMDLNGNFTYVSPSVQRLRGYTAEEVMRAPVEQALTPESAQRAAVGIRHVLETGEVLQHRWELEQPCKDGSTVWTDVMVNLMHDADGTPNGIIGITRDITEQRRIREELNTRSVAIEAAAEAVVIADPAGTVEYVNPAFTQMTGYTAQEVIGRKPSILKSGHQDGDFYRQLWATITAGKVWRGEIINRRKDGSLYTEIMAIAPVRDSQDRIAHYVAIKHDISARKELEARLEHLAHFDVLTNLPNRPLFFDRLERAIAAARRSGGAVGLLFLDLDGFKEINDTCGHDMGDRLLQEVAQRLQGCVRDSDTVARMGGDEFTVILRNIRAPINAEAVAGKIIASLSSPFHIDGHQLHIGTSIGISLYPLHADSLESLVTYADQAMYTVKHRGKNNYAVYVPLTADTPS